MDDDIEFTQDRNKNKSHKMKTRRNKRHRDGSKSRACKRKRIENNIIKSRKKEKKNRSEEFRSDITSPSYYNPLVSQVSENILLQPNIQYSNNSHIENQNSKSNSELTPQDSIKRKLYAGHTPWNKNLQLKKMTNPIDKPKGKNKRLSSMMNFLIEKEKKIQLYESILKSENRKNKKIMEKLLNIFSQKNPP